MVNKRIREFLHTEAASSSLLGLMVVLAMAAANSPFAAAYTWLHGPAPTVFINDGLMAIFFLVIGIELKRELMEGELSTPGQALLPVAGALGGVVLPAVIYRLLNDDAAALRGWAVPMATDIAFTLGLVGFFGRGLPASLRIFLMALAVIDDLFAILVIAVFYTSQLSWQALGMAAGIAALLLVYNRRVTRRTPFLLAGAALWLAMHESGVHATLAGVLLGLLLPLWMGKNWLRALHAPVAFGVIPLFVFANAGVPLSGFSAENVGHPVAMGIGLGLFAGKQLGIFAASWLLIALGKARLPAGASWAQFYGACMAAGIGFTMSLFIAALAFGGGELMTQARLGVICGSLASAIGAIIVFKFTGNKRAAL